MFKPTPVAHIDWLQEDIDKDLRTADGHRISVYDINHLPEASVLSAWAKHLRHHYCADDEIDILRKGPSLSRADYLKKMKLPDRDAGGLGPATRAGDFGEILVADFLEYYMDYWVPRIRYDRKNVRNESSKGCDVIGIKFVNAGQESPQDSLVVFECKTQFSGTKAKPRLQDAIDHNGKDLVRLAEGLNALRVRFLDKKDDAKGQAIERFQDLEGRPYVEEWGASALFDETVYSPASIKKTKAKGHPKHAGLRLIVMRGGEMMDLVHALYDAAANEA